MTLENIDRTIFNILRETVVAYGYLPDWNTITGTNPTERKQNYDTAKTALKADKGELIEVFGVGSVEFKGIKTSCRITIDRKSITNGSVAWNGMEVIEPDDTEFLRKRLPDNSANIEYEIRLVTLNKMMFERLLHEISRSSLGTHFRSIELIDNYFQLTGERVTLKYDGAVQVGSNDWLEWVLKYTVIDAVIDPTVALGTIVPISTINLQTSIETNNFINSISI